MRKSGNEWYIKLGKGALRETENRREVREGKEELYERKTGKSEKEAREGDKKLGKG